MLRILVTLVSMALLTGSAAAADISIADIFTGAGDPQSNEFLNMIFGSGLFEVTDGVGGTDETLISTLMTNFNVIFFAVGVLLLVYNIVVAVTETAHDGSVFGARHSALWAPIRLCVAAAMLIPLPAPRPLRSSGRRPSTPSLIRTCQWRHPTSCPSMPTSSNRFGGWSSAWPPTIRKSPRLAILSR